MISMCDEDGSGTCSKKEVMDMLKAQGMPED